MQRLFVGTLALLLATLPAGAATRHHHARRMARHSGEAGMPITAERDSIRINAVGQVISQPVPVIQKEKNINSRINQELAKPPAASPAPAAPSPTP